MKMHISYEIKNYIDFIVIIPIKIENQEQEISIKFIISKIVLNKN